MKAGLIPVTSRHYCTGMQRMSILGNRQGLLDQMACSVGGLPPLISKIPLLPSLKRLILTFPPAGMLCRGDTGGNHANLTGEYAAIPAEMNGCRLFRQGVLTDVEEQDSMISCLLCAVKPGQGGAAPMHFFDDDRLAKEEAEALKAGDFDGFKQKILESGRSSIQRLQNVFAVGSPQEQGVSLALALSGRFLSAGGVRCTAAALPERFRLLYPP